MDESQLASVIATLTSSLRSVDSNGVPNQLEDARRALANALLSGQTQAAIDEEGAWSAGTGDIPAAELDEIREMIRELVSTGPDRGLRVYGRRWPLLCDHNPQSVPGWARGATVAESIGPIESNVGQRLWFDVHRLVDSVAVVEAHTSRLLFTLPRDALPPDESGIRVRNIDVPAGSIWLDAQSFDPAAPAGSRAGLRVHGASVSFGQPASYRDNTIVVTSGVVTMHLHLATSETSSRNLYGGDSRGLRITPVSEATLVFDGAGSARLAHISGAAIEVFGCGVRLEQRAHAAARYDERLAQLWFPMVPDRNQFAAVESVSKMTRMAGTAAIADAGWVVPVADAITASDSPASELALAARTAGFLGLVLAGGLSAVLDSVPEPLILDTATMYASPTHLSMLASSALPRMRRTLELWSEGDGRHSHIAIRAHDPLLLKLDAASVEGGVEAVSLSALEITASIDRPLAASGQRVPFHSEHAALDVVRAADGRRLYLSAPADPPRDPVSGRRQALDPTSFSLSNAVVGASAAQSLHVGGLLGSAWRMASGVATLDFGIRFVLPILPDPYAANITRYAPRELLDVSPGRGRLSARVSWADSEAARISFVAPEHTEGELRHAIAELADAVDRPLRGGADRDSFDQEFLRLLDVSTNADLFGVGLTSGGAQMCGLELIAPLRAVSAFMLPAFQWEPVYNIPNPDAAPFPEKLTSPTDGGPTHFAAVEATLVPLVPLSVIDTMLVEYNQESSNIVARFTLPFGMVAEADIGREPFPSPGRTSPGFVAVRPQFPDRELHGAQQLSLTAARRLFAQPGAPSPGLPGWAVQTDNCAGATNVLDSGSVDDTFNATFAGELGIVPVQRIDFTGYGATVFSDWRHEGVLGSGVTQVKLEGMVGRTSREVVQVRSKLYPWGAVVVRTITMERTGGGGVFRRDSGWQAAGDARYEIDGEVHPGVVPRLTNIRRIRDTSNEYVRDYGGVEVKLTQVAFDADVEIESVTAGANGARLVPACDLVGYVQVLPIGVDLTAEQIDDLLAAKGPIGGAVDCELNVGESGLFMRLSRIEVDRTRTLGGFAQFVVVARGSVEVAGPGQWTFGYRGPGEAELHRLDANQTVPLIRANPFFGVRPPYRIANASELHRIHNPQSEFGLVHASGAQRLLIPQPQVQWGVNTLFGGAPVLFADMFALAGIVSYFPRTDRCHPLPSGAALRITDRGRGELVVPPQPGLGPGQFGVGVNEYTMSESAGLRMRTRYLSGAVITLAIDSGGDPEWSCEYGPVAMLNDVENFPELLQTIGTVTSSSRAAPQIRNPQIVFGDALGPVQTIISLLTAFGLPLPFDLSITNAEFVYKTGIRYKFPAPGFITHQTIAQLLKLGPGLAPELELKVLTLSSGTASGKGRAELEVDAKLFGRVLELGLAEVFVGGAFKFEIGAEEDGNTTVTTAFGIAGMVEADWKLIKASATRTYMGVREKTAGHEVKMGFSSSWEGEFEILFGLASIGLNVELLTLVHKKGDVLEWEGKGTIAVEVTVGWAWEHEIELEVEVSEELAIAAFVATSMLP